MAFELETATKAYVRNVVVLSQKNREPSDNPGAKLLLDLQLPNRHLLGFGAGLLTALYERDEASPPPPQGELDGVDAVSELPDLTEVGSSVGVLQWHRTFTGYHLTVDQGLGDEGSSLHLDEGKLSGFRIKPQDGGTFTLKCEFEAPNASERDFGRLAKLKGRHIDITLIAPEVEDDPQRDVENWPGQAPAADVSAPKKARRKTATEAFVDAHGIPD